MFCQLLKAAPFLAVVCAVMGAAEPAGAQSLFVTVDGTLAYQGKSDATTEADFKVRGARVEVWRVPDDAVSELDFELMGTVFTADDGSYSLGSVQVLETDGLFVRVLPESKDGSAAAGQPKSKIRVVEYDSGTMTSSTYAWDAGVQLVDPTEMSYTFDHTFDAGNPLDWSFSVFDAALTQARFHDTRDGVTVNEVPIRFGGQSQTFFDRDDTFISLVDGDRFDWDVIGEEYQHYMQEQFGTEDSPGGSHFSTYNLRFFRPGLDSAQQSKLGWAEGAAQFFSLVAQREQMAQTLGIHNVGDDNFVDMNDSDVTMIGIQKHAENDTGRPSLGEDQEVSVMRILWDIYDSTNDAADCDLTDDTADKIWNLIDDNSIHTLSAFWDEYTDGMSAQNKAKVGGIFMAHNVGAKPDDTSMLMLDKDGAAPKFEWTIPTGQSPNVEPSLDLMNTFGLKFFTDDWATELLDIDLSAEGKIDEWTLDAAQWDMLNDHVGGVNWVVLAGWDAADGKFDSGLYWSKAEDFTIIPEPSTALLLAGSLCMLRRRRAA